MNGPELTRPVELDRLDEENTSKDDLDEEFLFYRYVAAGRISKVQENCNCTAFETVAGASMLSSDPLTNLKYHFVVTAAMLARTCSEGGMASAEAFELSSVYIQKMDRCTDAAGVVLLHDQMALDYAGRMRVKKKSSATSMHVSEAIDYIYQHVLERITVDELADVIHVSPNYLSRSFKQATGVSVSEYTLSPTVYRLLYSPSLKISERKSYAFVCALIALRCLLSVVHILSLSITM